MDHSDDHGRSALSRIEENKDFNVVVSLVQHVRSRSPRSVTARELSLALNRPKQQIYALVKISRRWLALTTGEYLPNARRMGYRITSNPRAGLYESIKSGNRADGHLGAEISTFSRIRREDLKTIEDIELYVQQQGRIVLGRARLEMSEKMQPVIHRLRANSALARAAAREALTPWEDLGLEDPTAAEDGTN